MAIKVSIQIPTFNQQQYISRALESCLAQDYPHLEIIVSDDCSTDDTEKIVKSYPDPRLKYFRNTVNIGRVANYRKALYEYCTGEWVVNLDGDDYYIDPAFVSRGVQLINEYKAAGHVVVFYQSLIELRNEITGETISKMHRVLGDRQHDVFSDYYPEVYRRNEFFSHLTTIYHRPTALKVGFYEQNTLNTDAESIARLSFHGKAVLDNSVSGVWRVHDQNATRKTRSEFLRDGMNILKRLELYAFKKAYADDEAAQKKLKRQHRELYLEQLAEYGLFPRLLKFIFKYREPYGRIPKLLVKAALKNLYYLTARQ